MGTYSDYYCSNGNQRLKPIVDNIIRKQFSWLPQSEYDECYSIAGQTLWNCEEHFDESKDTHFETFLIGCLVRKFKTRITYMNRKRRNGGSHDMSLDALIDDNDTTIMNLISVIDEPEITNYSDKMTKYLQKLSSLQKKILFDMADGYSKDEIKKRHRITSKQLSDACNTIKAYRNVSILY